MAEEQDLFEQLTLSDFKKWISQNERCTLKSETIFGN